MSSTQLVSSDPNGDQLDNGSEAQGKSNQEEETNTHLIRPSFKNKFRKAAAEELIKEILHEKLNGLIYHAEKTSQWTTQIADEVKNRLKDMQIDRYKFVVQIVIGEQRGEGVNMGCRCFWDSDCDKYAESVFMNDTLFCVCAVFGVYFY